VNAVSVASNVVPWPRDESRAGTGESPVTLVVPDGQVFVLGDNRGTAIDSRKFGTVPLSDIKAVARQVWFSIQPGAGVRWGRMGHLSFIARICGFDNLLTAKGDFRYFQRPARPSMIRA